MRAHVQDMTQQLWAGIASARRMELGDVVEAVKRAPLLAAAALKGDGASARAAVQGAGRDGEGGGSSSSSEVQDAPPLPPPAQLPSVPLLDGLSYKDEVGGWGLLCWVDCEGWRICIYERFARPR